MTKNKKISYEVTDSWDWFTTVIYTEMCFSNKYKYRTLMEGIIR